MASSASTFIVCDGSPSPKTHYQGLAPPIGTMFWKRIDVSIIDDHAFTDASQTWAVGTWRTEVYVYVSGAAPDDPQFAAKGGVITVVIVHQGQYNDVHTLLSTELQQSVTCPIPTISKMQHPSTNSGTHVDDQWQYRIDYKEDLSMFNNGGNEVFTFTPQFLNDFSLYQTTQDGQEVTNGLPFTMQTQAPLKLHQLGRTINVPLNGLSVFRFNNPNTFPMTFKFNASVESIISASDPPSVSKSQSVDLDFSQTPDVTIDT